MYEQNPFELSKELPDNSSKNNNEHFIHQDSRQQIQILANELAKEIVDRDTMEKYGTSLNEAMTHDYVKTLEKKYFELKKQFDTIDTNSNSELTLDEVYNFLFPQKINAKKFIESINKLSEYKDYKDYYRIIIQVDWSLA